VIYGGSGYSGSATLTGNGDISSVSVSNNSANSFYWASTYIEVLAGDTVPGPTTYMNYSCTCSVSASAYLSWTTNPASNLEATLNANKLNWNVLSAG
jgi:hypothetical protein